MYSYAAHIVMAVIVFWGVVGTLTFIASRENRQPLHITPWPAWLSWVMWFCLMAIMFMDLAHSVLPH